MGGLAKNHPTQNENEDASNHRYGSSDPKRKETSTAASTFQDEPDSRLRGVESGDGKGFFGDDGDSDENDMMERRSEHRSAESSKARSLSKEEFESMAGFLAERGCTEESSHVGLADWKTFYKQVSLIACDIIMQASNNVV